MRGHVHDRLSSDTMVCVDVDNWSSKKDLMHLTRSEVRVSTFTEAGKICLERALLETERRYFNNETETTFAKINEEIVMNLTNREKATLALDPRKVFNSKVNNDERFWLQCKDCLQACYREYHVQTKAHHRKKIHH